MNPIPLTGTPIREYKKGEIGKDEFFRDVLPAAMPVVMRGLIDDWPAVAASKSSTDFVDYLLMFASAQPVEAAIGPPDIGGRLFYNTALDGLNFRRESLQLGAVLTKIILAANQSDPSAIAIQSLRTAESLPGFDRDNRLTWLPDFIKARAWIGNRITVAAHYDSSENIACVVAGRRRFTLFHPDQASKLYPGPFELTPAGPVVSMVNFDSPDLENYPRFPEALDRALVADIGPGDAIYIPYLWWHHVRSIDPLNMLVNYWWNPDTATVGRPLDAMQHAMLAIKNLDPPHRQAWAALFDHYVFQRDTKPGMHLPHNRRGIQGTLSPNDQIKALSQIADFLLPNQTK